MLTSSFMDEIQEQIEGVEENAGIVKDLYDLVEQYQVPVNPEDMAVYQVMHSTSQDMVHTWHCICNINI